MPFQLSPGVVVTERDLTNIVPAVSTTAGGFAGSFKWGPVEEIVTIESENELVRTFGTPDDDTATSFFSAASFLSYGNNLQVVRLVGTGATNAIANSSVAALLIKNEVEYLDQYAGGSASVGEFAAKFPGSRGNSLAVVMFDGATASNVTVTLGSSTIDVAALFDADPSTSSYVASLGGSDDELHLAVFDADGSWSGEAGTLLEKFSFMSKAVDAKNFDGTSNYYKNIINNQSKYLWWMDHPDNVGNWGSNALGVTFDDMFLPLSYTLSGGVDNNATANIDLTDGLALFSNDETVDVSLIVMGEASATEIQYAIDNVAESRRDCVVFFSPERANVVNNVGNEASEVVAFRNTVARSSSYAVMDCGWKYQYDRYNDVYRWVPLNGDVAGLCARTDSTNDPWWSPAGFNRGNIKNAVKLAWSPSKTDRDTLYKVGVNPVVSFPGQGIVLYGDKTLLSKPSAFDRINVRRLFIVIEKAIATASKYQLFEFNDAFTQAQFRNLVEPYLRDVQGRRGITSFRVVCDGTNNTSEVVDRNEFVADIYIAPSRSINFIQLNFIATRTGVAFQELGA